MTKESCAVSLEPTINNPDAKLQDIITSIYDIGFEAGALFKFFFGEQFGRKNMIIAGGTTMIIGTILLGLSFVKKTYLMMPPHLLRTSQHHLSLSGR
jgi:MFS family permease